MKQYINRLLPKSMRSDAVTIPVVRMQGAIMATGGQFRPTLSITAVAPLLEKAFADKQAPAVAIAINSPGGSAVQSRLIFQRIRSLAEEKNKKVLVFVEDVAASGGYMIAAAGDEIFADPSSIIGSIGVVSASFGFQEMIKKIGVERRVHTAGKNKVTLDPFQPEKKADVEKLKAIQLQIHDVFINLVKSRRSGKLAEDPDMFTGAFWAGEKAKELGLIDEIGDLRSVLKTRFGPKTRMRLITPPRGLFGRRLGISGAFASDIAANAAGGIAQAVEERALWGRFGL